MRRAVTIIATAALALGLAACGEKHEQLNAPAAGAQPVSLMLDYFPNADHVGIYQAIADGDFAKAGLNVSLKVPSDPAEPLKLLAAGKVDAAISYEPEVLLARNQGEAVVSVAAIVQKPLTSIISVGSKHITSPRQLKGKTVGDAGIPYQHAYLTTILQQAGVPVNSVTERNVGFNLVPAMISGKVDATLGGYWNYEAIQLAQQKKHPNVIRMDQVGVPTYDELVVVVRKSTLVNNTSVIRRLVQAMARGYQAARADPSGAVDNLIKANPGLDRTLQLASVKATMPAFFPAGDKPWGWQSATLWNAYGQWMMDHHLISNPNAISAASTNELLAGQGL
jgi:putative hydroxymethylpyrimidine transport system substrate-binding protein